MQASERINRIAATGAIVAIALGVGWSVLARVDSGIRLGLDARGQLVIREIRPYSPATNTPPWAGQSELLQPGWAVIDLNGRTVLTLPQPVLASPLPTPDPVTGDTPEPSVVGMSPATPQLAVDPAQLPGLAEQPVYSISAAPPDRLAAWSLRDSPAIWDRSWAYTGDAIATLAVGMIAMFLAAWWLGTGRAGPMLQPLALPAALAIGGPMVLWPVAATGSSAGLAIYSVAMPLSLLSLAAALASRTVTPAERALVAVGAAACAAGAMAIGMAQLLTPVADAGVGSIAILAGGITALPGLAAAGAVRTTVTEGDPDGVASRRVVGGASVAALGFTPFFSVFVAAHPSATLLLPAWLAALWIASRLTVRPLTRLAGRAQLQRDLVVAATEAERARVAADIHDDALQELTLLLRRLDAAGDAEGAEMARGISNRLRAICGDLRLPILDDLGIGPALDWLVVRIERLSGGEVRLELADGSRPPADVELAFFRVAQEALSNAVKHGRPPIVIRYRSADGFASLSIDDAGTGIAADARQRAEADGHHFGLLNMAQRAEAIGAILDVRRWPTGGTHVGLEWRAR